MAVAPLLHAYGGHIARYAVTTWGAGGDVRRPSAAEVALVSLRIAARLLVPSEPALRIGAAGDPTLDDRDALGLVDAAAIAFVESMRELAAAEIGARRAGLWRQQSLDADEALLRRLVEAGLLSAAERLELRQLVASLRAVAVPPVVAELVDGHALKQHARAVNFAVTMRRAAVVLIAFEFGSTLIDRLGLDEKADDIRKNRLFGRLVALVTRECRASRVAQRCARVCASRLRTFRSRTRTRTHAHAHAHTTHRRCSRIAGEAHHRGARERRW